MGALYWDLKSRQRNQGLALKEAMAPFLKGMPKTKSFLSDEMFWESYRDLEKTLQGLFSRILEGDYSLTPAACLGNRCEFAEICRYGNKPR